MNAQTACGYHLRCPNFSVKCDECKEIHKDKPQSFLVDRLRTPDPNETAARNIVSRFMTQTNKGAIAEEDFCRFWSDTIVAVHALAPRLSGDHVAGEMDRILGDLCRNVHPVDEKTGQPFIAKKEAIVAAVETAVKDICGLVAIGGR